MGMIINIDEALKQHATYNVLKEPLNQMLQDQQEAWEKENPIDLLFTRGTLSGFQETYTSSIGFAHAFAETSDYAVGPIFNTADGFSATYRTRTFQGGFIITQQAMEDRQMGKIKDDANAFVKRWHGDIVEYAMTAISGGFGKEVTWGDASNGGKSRIKLTSADTASGDINDGVKNPLFYNKHTIVKRDGMSEEDVQAKYQSNLYYVPIDLAADDAGKIAKLADAINWVITEMENYYDDNGKIAGVHGAKSIVAPNDARLKAALETALSMEMLNDVGQALGPNPAYKRATVATTPYLRNIPQGMNGRGFFIVDKAYNEGNHGPEFTERIPFTLNVEQEKRPYGVVYDGRQRFDINSASWRGIAYVYVGTPEGLEGAWDNVANFTRIDAISTVSKPVAVTNVVKTKEQE